ncbi:hypothetical protein GCM10010420_55010 [Streptomyces glaucosporus]|uniref:Helicase-associated domain-containing protein n=1 Tax=Streptomyces glaucosporus TaxID=284044 RepID=A0ABN3J0C2_9ACTN
MTVGGEEIGLWLARQRTGWQQPADRQRERLTALGITPTMPAPGGEAPPGGAGHPPTERTAAYAAALLRRWPDMDEDEDEDDSSPWCSGPLIDEASGPLLYIAPRWSTADEASPYATQLATPTELACSDIPRNKHRP